MLPDAQMFLSIDNIWRCLCTVTRMADLTVMYYEMYFLIDLVFAMKYTGKQTESLSLILSQIPFIFHKIVCEDQSLSVQFSRRFIYPDNFLETKFLTRLHRDCRSLFKTDSVCISRILCELCHYLISL